MANDMLTADTIIDAWKALNALPLLGAIIGVRSWRNGGMTLELTVGTVEDDGWRLVRNLAGAEAADIAKRYAGRKVVLMSESDMVRVQKSDPNLNDPTRMFSVPMFVVDGAVDTQQADD